MIIDKKIRGVARKLLEGISESLGLESNSIIESSGFDSGLQLFIANLYPPCSQPHLALGMLPHSFLTLVTQNGIGRLQVKHDGKWVNVNPLPNSLMVILGDQLEVTHSPTLLFKNVSFANLDLDILILQN